MSDGENESWVGINSFQLFDTKLSDHVLTYKESKGWALQGTYVYKEAVAGSRYGYPDFYAKCLEEYNEATEGTPVNGVTIKVYSNGHKYYNIADKGSIDDFYNTHGAAWFYGIDTENERIFLPRNNWFEQATGTTNEVNIFIEAGLPNHTHTLANGDIANNNMTGSSGYLVYRSDFGGGDYKYNLATSATYPTNGKTGYASDSNPIYGKSGTVQPNAVKKLLYICVGNTTSESAITDVIDVTTTENDTVPLGYSTYQTGIQPNTSWLKSLGQWNDGKVYTTFYEEFVNKIGQAFAGGYVKEITETYDDYDLVINQDDMTFRLPLLDGSECLPSDKLIIGIFTTLSTTKQSYICPANGFVSIGRNALSSDTLVVYRNAQEIFRSGSTAGINNDSLNIPVRKGDIISAHTDTVTANETISCFEYAQGNGSLYFKVANAVENLELLDVGEVMTSLADKIGRQDCPAYIIETYVNGTSGYRIWSDGYCEQWGQSMNTGTVTFLKTFANTNWNFCCGIEFTRNQYGYDAIASKTVNGFTFYTILTELYQDWKVSGYLAEGEY